MQGFESWVVYYVARKKLSPGFLQQLYTVKSRMVRLWGANPRHCDRTVRNPLDRLRLLFEALDLHGYSEYAIAALDWLGEPLGRRSVAMEPSRSDKGSVDGEAADAVVALGYLVAKIREVLADKNIDPEERIEIEEAYINAKRQIEEIMDAAGMYGDR